MRRIRKVLPVNFHQELSKKLNDIPSVQNVAVIEGATPSYFEFDNGKPASGVPVRFYIETVDENNFGKLNLTLYMNSEEYTNIFFEGVQTLIENDIQISEISLHHTCGYWEYFNEKLDAFNFIHNVSQ